MDRLTFATDDKLGDFARSLKQAKDFLQSTEATYAHCAVPPHVYELLRAARTSLNAASRDILREAREQHTGTHELVK